jgi:hypothetical protein
MSQVNFKMLKIPELKIELRKYGLQVSGNKQVLIDRLTEFLNPPQFHREESKSNAPDAIRANRGQKQSQKTIVNIYTDGKVVDSNITDGTQNIYIGKKSTIPFLPGGNNPSMSSQFKFPPVQTVKPVFYKQPEKTKQEVISGIPSSGMIGEEDEVVAEKPKPKKLNLSKQFLEKLNKAVSGNQPTTNQTLSKSIPLPPNVILPIPKPPAPPSQNLTKKQEQVFNEIKNSTQVPPNITETQYDYIIKKVLLKNWKDNWSDADSKILLLEVDNRLKKL